jgi:hypothetical protein
MDKQAKTDSHPIELVVNATPSVLSPIIKTAVREFEPEEGLEYAVYEESRSTSDAYRRLLVVAFGVAVNAQITRVDCIGIITLQSLGTNQTLFRVPPRDNWTFTDAPHILSNSDCKGLVNRYAFNLHWNESYFTKVLEKILNEFYRLSFIDLKIEKEPLGFKPPSKE